MTDRRTMRLAGFLLAVMALAAGASGQTAAKGQPKLDVAYYPYEQKVRAQLTFADAKAIAAAKGARVEITKTGDKEPIVSVDADLIPVPQYRGGPDNLLVRQVILDTPTLDSGKYKVSVVLKGQSTVSQRPIVQTFDRKVWEWEHNDLGTSRRVVAPFIPLRISGEDDMDHRPKVHSILRTHTMNSFGLWDQVLAKGEPILASPIMLQASSAGKEVEFKNGPIAVTESSPDCVRLETPIVSESLSGKVISTFDYDGMMKVELELAATEKNVESLVLLIPVKKEIAELLHVSGDCIRENFAGEMPKGDGIIWFSKGANGAGHGYGGIWGTFMPYVWMGGPERGICWFADNDRDWSLNDDLSALDIVRKGESVILRVHLINKPTRMNRDRRIVFGLQATPVKPLPAPVDGMTWRSWSFSGTYPGATTVTAFGQSLMWGATEASSEIYPRGRDFAIFDEFDRGRKARNAYTGWVDESGWLKGYPDQSRIAEYRGDVIAGLTASSMADILIMYTDARGAEDSNCEESLNYNPRPLAGNVWDEPAPSMQDFSLFYLNEMMKRGVDGIYLDNTYARGNFDTISSDAYIRDDGKIQPSVGIWRMREYVKRIAHMYDETGRKPHTMLHMTNGNIMPVMSFGTIALDWEQHHGPTDFQTRFPLDYILAESIGLQAGLVPVGLGGVREIEDAAEFRRVSRTEFGVALIHEIKMWGWFDGDEVGKLYKAVYAFGYGKEDCKVYTYWDDNQPVKISGADAKALVMHRDGKAMIVLTSFGNSATSVLKLDTAALGLSAGFAAKNAETGESIATNGSEVTLELPRHDVRLIVLE